MGLQVSDLKFLDHHCFCGIPTASVLGCKYLDTWRSLSVPFGRRAAYFVYVCESICGFTSCSTLCLHFVLVALCGLDVV